jgi:hypothetical protein
LINVSLKTSTSTAAFGRWVMQVNEYKAAVKKTIMLAFKKFPHRRDISFHLCPLTAVALAHSDNPYVLRSLLESHINIINGTESYDARSESGPEALITARIKGSVLRKSSTLIMDAILDRIHGMLQRDLIITSLHLCVVSDMNKPLKSLIAHCNSNFSICPKKFSNFLKEPWNTMVSSVFNPYCTLQSRKSKEKVTTKYVTSSYLYPTTKSIVHNHRS